LTDIVDALADAGAADAAVAFTPAAAPAITVNAATASVRRTLPII
jgi:hypothetical protein